jgi:CPA2 family monovalent cation:H+ antiporter-2
MFEDPVANLGLVFIFIGLAVLTANKLKFSSIPLLILLGIFFGPHAPGYGWLDLRLINVSESIELLSRLGALFLLFHLGLEFSAGKVVENGVIILKGGSIYVGLNFIRGLALGWVFFGSVPEMLVMAGITTVSSSAIITRLLMELKRTANPETELILGIMVFEDIFMALYLSFLSGYLLFQKAAFSSVFLSSLAVMIFVFFLLLGARRLSVYLNRLLSIHSGEVFTVLAFALILLAAFLADVLHVTEAAGALLLGLVLAETLHAKRLIQIFAPLRDLFGGVFFLSFGMNIDYHQFAAVSGIAVMMTFATIAGNLLAGYLSARACGYRGPAAANIACTIIARGEFSVVVAGLAATAGMVGIMQPFAALYVLLLALASPVLAKRARKIYTAAVYFWNKLSGIKQILGNFNAGKE